jgi:hypothetical protein
MEYKVDNVRMHYAVGEDDRMHYRADSDKLHYATDET